jgi:uroporphyrinogen-III synthase
LVAIGPVCATAMQEYGLRVDVQPAEPKMGPMVLAVDQFVSNQTRDRRAVQPSAT